jgi:hypothetical protein
MDNDDIVREFKEMRDHISALDRSVAELTRSNAVLAAQVSPIVDWVKEQMSNGLAKRMDVLESDMSGVKTGLEELRSLAQKVVGGAAVLLFLWGIFGDSLKKGLLGK